MTRAMSWLVGALAALALLAACMDEGAGSAGWIEPEGGRPGAPRELDAAELPFQGRIAEGSAYYRIAGLPPGERRLIAVTRLDADADLFVLGNAAFTQYRCSSISSGASDEACTAPAGPAGDLYVQVYGYSERPTTFVLDVHLR